MRVIFLVRSAQLLVTLRALWMLYSVSAFCEKTEHRMINCPDVNRGIPLVPEKRDDHLRIRHERPASNRPVKNTSDVSPTTTDTATTAHALSSIESSTVTESTNEVKTRKKRDEEKKVLPGNGMTEAERKKAEAAETKKEEKKHDEVKTEDTTPKPVHAKEKKEEKKEEQKSEELKKTEEKKEEKKSDATTATASTNAPVKEEKVHQGTKKSEEVTKVEKMEDKKSEATTATASTNAPVKEEKGAKVEIPVAVTPKEDYHDEKKTDEKTDHAHSTEQPHHTVKKDLKAHVQEPVMVEEKEVSARPPVLSPVQEQFVLEHSDAFLQEVRCLEVTSDDYFGKQLSPYAEHLKGLAFVGPVLVVIAIYLVCTVLRTKLTNEPPTEFTSTLGCAFHAGMWFVVAISMYFIANHWTDNWNTVSNATFAPEFPCAWFNLIILACFMMMATSIELWFPKRMHYDIVMERSYRCYEVIDNSDATAENEGRFSRTNVY